MKTREIGSKKILAIGLIALLAIAVLSTSTSVFAKPDSEKGKGKGNGEKNKEKGQSQQESKNNKDSKGKNNSTSSTNNQASANVTGQNSASKQYNHTESSLKKDNKSKNNESGNQSLTASQYTAGMHYVLSAQGTAIPISDDSSSTSNLTNTTGTTTPTNTTAASNLDSADEGATISLDLSVRKSTKGLVAFKVMSGMITIGDETYLIDSGKALYILKAHKLIVTAFTEDKGKPLKLKAIVLEDTTLPATESDPALQLDILSPQSKLASKYFLEMEGYMSYHD